MTNLFEIFDLKTACLSALCDERFPTALHAWREADALGLPANGTHSVFYMIWDSDYGLRTGDYLINLQDTINTKLHSDRTRISGCCGPGGTDGLNLVCINGHEVGTKSADCYMAHSITFTPETTTLQIV